MADHVLFIGWNRSVVGREQHAVQLFQKTVEFYGKLQAEVESRALNLCSSPLTVVT